ncbi:S8 family serine peptidase [Micromonospora sp. KLBMP9576]|uniref:S8 family serine peptidase n=1 Tax=Micromonospora sp. KLBMP9576 TaxID=3424769 RepID=UPI003D91351C
MKTASRRCFAILLGLVAAALPVAPAQADDQAYVKYHTVTTSYQGAPETLPRIAERFLGTADRADEVFHLNLGRQQADGGALTAPDKLRPGWRLVLPWDAVGAGVQYGTLTGTPAPAPGSTTAPPKKTPAPRPTGARESSPPSGDGPSAPQQGSTPPAGSPQQGTTAPAGSPQQGMSPAVPPRQPAVQPTVPPRAPGAAQCRPTPARKGVTGSDWAAKRLGAERAWGRSRGKGQLIAVIDSGVDAALAPLAGRVTVGVGIDAGGGPGNIDCLGTGTAMAGIIVAQPAKGSTLVGVAPDATVLPVRLVSDKPTARPEDQASAVDRAVASGATVIALGSSVDLNETLVAKAITAATAKDVVVVAGAARDGTPVNASAALPEAGLLRVGAIGANGQSATKYRPGGVDVVAPGIDVSSLGLAGTGRFVGTGDQYAVAYVAGEAALVRSAHPDLRAHQVVARVKATARKPTDNAAGASYGQGMIDPVAAVQAVLPEEQPVATPAENVNGPASGANRAPGASGGGRTVALAMTVLAVAAALMLLAFWLRLLLRARTTPVADPYQDLPDAAGSWPDPASGQGKGKDTDRSAKV